MTKEMVDAALHAASAHGQVTENVVRDVLEAGVGVFEKGLGTKVAAPYVEIDDGSLTFRDGSLSITVMSQTAVVFDASRPVPARAIRLTYDDFWDDADDFMRRRGGVESAG